MKHHFLLAAAIATLPLKQAFSQTPEQEPSSHHQPRFYSQVPWGVDFQMEGTVTNVVAMDGRIQFRLNGHLRLAQFPPDNPKRVFIEVHGKDAISATVTQAKPFFAMTTDWRAGALRKEGELLKILK